MGKKLKKTKGLWRGKPIEKYSRVELEEIIVELGEMHSRALIELTKRHGYKPEG